MRSPMIWEGDYARLLPSGGLKDASGNVITGVGNAFATIQTDAGTSPVADQGNDTVTFTSTDLDITGNSGTDTVTWNLKSTVSAAKTFSSLIGYKASQAISSTSIDWSTGNHFTKTISGNTTFTFSNATDGQSITVRITAGSGNTVTWPTVKWTGGAAPTQTSSGTDIYAFLKDGSDIYGTVHQGMS